MNTPDFTAFPKMARFSREIIITEKIDGTNASIFITDDGQFFTASRTRWITPEDDNSGFSRWAHDNKEDLLKLGPGHHFGEWWGKGIQRNYGLQEKRFSLFNTYRWGNKDVRPACCHVVPVLWQGVMRERQIMNALFSLEMEGSRAAPGFSDPEGVVIFHTAANMMFKKTIKKDEGPKSLVFTI